MKIMLFVIELQKKICCENISIREKVNFQLRNVETVYKNNKSSDDGNDSDDDNSDEEDSDDES